MAEKRRILTGDRPTGRLHLGHYVGSLRNRVRLQDEYECFFIIADLHMLTTKPEPESIAEIADNARGMVLDYLSVGIDPAKSTIFLQSAVHETYELALLLGNLVTVPRLARLPSIKEMARAALMDEEAIPFGLLGYPVLQAADILLPKAHLVPVGKDNQAHVEVTRELARRFNSLYGEVFPIPDDLVQGDTLPGTDGQAKMSKSLGNAIFLCDDHGQARFPGCGQGWHQAVPGRLVAQRSRFQHDRTEGKLDSPEMVLGPGHLPGQPQHLLQVQVLF